MDHPAAQASQATVRGEAGDARPTTVRHNPSPARARDGVASQVSSRIPGSPPEVTARPWTWTTIWKSCAAPIAPPVATARAGCGPRAACGRPIAASGTARYPSRTRARLSPGDRSVRAAIAPRGPNGLDADNSPPTLRTDHQGPPGAAAPLGAHSPSTPARQRRTRRLACAPAPPPRALVAPGGRCLASNHRPSRFSERHGSERTLAPSAASRRVPPGRDSRAPLPGRASAVSPKPEARSPKPEARSYATFAGLGTPIASFPRSPSTAPSTA